MRRTLIIALGLALPLAAFSQGAFFLFTDTAPTRVGAVDGPLAGPGIWAQAFGGFTADSLQPIGTSVQHVGEGLTFGLLIIVPWADVNQTIFVQMAAWDGTVWGTSFAGVSSDFVGYTDKVTVLLTSPTANPNSTRFTQPAIVPIPEPSAFALVGLGGAALFAFRKRRRIERGPSELQQSHHQFTT